LALKGQLTTCQLNVLDPNGRIHRQQGTGFIGCLRPETQGSLLGIEAETAASGVLMSCNSHL
tara:strand:+ start:321 stop:506 length:186 start_codon:yes stop_codon:yes gene_type:complete